MSPRKSVFVRCLLFFDRIAGKAAAQFLEDLTVYLREHDGGVNLTIAQLWQLFQSLPTIVVMGREHAEGHQHLVGMQTGVLTAQIFDFRLLNWFDQTLWNQFDLVVNASQILGGIEQQSCTAP